MVLRGPPTKRNLKVTVVSLSDNNVVILIQTFVLDKKELQDSVERSTSAAENINGACNFPSATY